MHYFVDGAESGLCTGAFNKLRAGPFNKRPRKRGTRHNKLKARGAASSATSSLHSRESSSRYSQIKRARSRGSRLSLFGSRPNHGGRRTCASGIREGLSRQGLSNRFRSNPASTSAKRGSNSAGDRREGWPPPSPRVSLFFSKPDQEAFPFDGRRHSAQLQRGNP